MKRRGRETFPSFFISSFHLFAINCRKRSLMARQTDSVRIERLLWLGGLAIILFFLALILDGVLSQTRGGDGPSYLILARSLVEGFGYADMNIPGAPPHTQYPPLFPLLLAPVYLAFGYNFLVIKLIVAVFAIASLFAVRAFFSGHGGKFYGTFIAILTGTNFFFLFFTNEILTEIPYMFLSFMALLYARKNVSNGDAVQYFLVLPLLLALAYMTRTIGMTLVAASFITVILGLRGSEALSADLKKKVLFAAAVLVPFVIWTVRNGIYAQDVATYQSIFAHADYYSLDSGEASLGSLWTRFLLNSGYYSEGIYEMLVPFMPENSVLFLAGVIAVLLLVMTGFVRELLFRREMKDFYFLLYLGLLMVWQVYGQGDAQRYLVPLIPFLYHYLFTGVGVVWDGTASSLTWMARRRGAVFAVFAVLFALLNLTETNYRFVNSLGWNFDGLARISEGKLLRDVRSVGVDDLGGQRLRKNTPCFYNYLLAAGTLRDSLPEGGVVMARKPEIVYLLIDRPVVRFPYTSRAGLMEGFMKEKGVSHVLMDGCYMETDIFVRRYFQSRPESYRVLLSDGQGTAVLKLQ